MAFLIPFHISVVFVLTVFHTPTILSFIFVNTPTTLSTSEDIPLKRPCIKNVPISSMTFDGLAIPNAFLNPSIKGWKICSYIHCPIFFIPSHMPSSSPDIVNCPSSKATSFHHSTTLLHASSINPQRKAARPPKAAPMPSASRSAIPVQSIEPMKSATLFPNSCQLVFSRNDIMLSKSPFISSPSCAPFPIQSKSVIKVFTLVASCKPNSDQSKVVAMFPSTSNTAFHFSAKKCPIPSQSTVLTIPFRPLPMNCPTESQCVLSRKEFIPANPVFIASPIVRPIVSPNPPTSTNPFINVPMDLPILDAVAFSGSQFIPSRAVFSFVPNIAPISVKSAAAHASFNFCAKSEILLSIGTSVNISAGEISPPPPAPPFSPSSLFMEIVFNSSKARIPFCTSFPASFVAFPAPDTLAA